VGFEPDPRIGDFCVPIVDLMYCWEHNWRFLQIQDLIQGMIKVFPLFPGTFFCVLEPPLPVKDSPWVV
jgi:hypothetical protein